MVLLEGVYSKLRNRVATRKIARSRDAEFIASQSCFLYGSWSKNPLPPRFSKGGLEESQKAAGGRRQVARPARSRVTLHK